jgi:uncharacterized membrane protein (DUF2068 family)
MTASPAPATRRDPVLAIAAFKLFHAVLLFAVALGVHHLLHRDAAETLRHWAAALRVDPHEHGVERVLAAVTRLPARRLEAVGLGLAAYGMVYVVEGVGLLLRKRWAEWLTVVSTALLLPLEVRELVVRPGVLRAAILVANALIVVYLIVRLRRDRRRIDARAS